MSLARRDWKTVLRAVVVSTIGGLYVAGMFFAGRDAQGVGDQSRAMRVHLYEQAESCFTRTIFVGADEGTRAALRRSLRLESTIAIIDAIGELDCEREMAVVRRMMPAP